MHFPDSSPGASRYCLVCLCAHLIQRVREWAERRVGRDEERRCCAVFLGLCLGQYAGDAGAAAAFRRMLTVLDSRVKDSRTSLLPK